MYTEIAAINATPIPDEFNPLKNPVQLSKELTANVSVVALTTVLLGKLELVF